MGYVMNTNGEWVYKANSNGGNKPTSSNTESSAKKSDKGNTADTESSIKETNANKTESIKYAEEATFTCDGDYTIRKYGHIKVGKGVASRWQTKWLILETTHTIDVKGYKTEGRLGRIPYTDSTSSSSTNTSTSSTADKANKNTTDATKTDTSGTKWVMDKNGNWTKVSK